MITITEKATQKINEMLVQEQKQGHGIRLAVAGGGCSGFQYQLAFDEKAEDGSDEVVGFDGFEVFIDKTSAQYVKGVEIDYVETVQGEGFKINNPNATGGCGCGDSFSV